MDGDCPFRESHPEYMARVDSLSDTMHRLEDEVIKLRDARMTDYQTMNTQLGQVHEKVNDVASNLAGLNGKLIAFGLLTTGAGAIIMLLLAKLTKV